MGKRKERNLQRRRSTHQRETASPSPSGGGDVRGYGGMRKEGMCLTGYRMLGVGEIKGGEIKAKSSWVNSQRSKVFEVKNMLCRTQTTYLLIRKFVVFILQFPYLLIRKFVVLNRQLTISQFVNSWFLGCK